MNKEALRYLRNLALACVTSLLILAAIPGDQDGTATYIGGALVASVTAIAALVSPTRPGGQ